MTQFWNRLSRRERTLALVAVAIFVGVILYDRVITPLIARRALVRQQLVLEPKLFKRSLRYLRRKQDIETQLDEARKQVESMDRLLWVGETPSVIAAELQKVVRGIAAREGVEIATTRVLDSKETGAFLRIPIQVDLVGKIEQVANLIKYLDSNPKYLIVDEVNIRAARRERLRRGRGSVGQVSDELRVSLVISGVAKKQPAAVATN
jgi:type II secretory pathway component PulM